MGKGNSFGLASVVILVGLAHVTAVEETIWTPPTFQAVVVMNGI